MSLLAKSFLFENLLGEVAEWLKAHAWKACVLLKVPRVRIPLSPPNFRNLRLKYIHSFYKLTYRYLN